MVLAASLVIRNEHDRYLPIVVEHLRAFCDQITIIDDGSIDGTPEYLSGQNDGQVMSIRNPGETFDQHEGHVRQALLEFTLSRRPTHVLAIDADEFISDGHALRQLLTDEPDVPAWTLTMTEVWKADPAGLSVRTDGAWRPYERIHLWAVPPQLTPDYRITERKLACSPVPRAVGRMLPRPSGIEIFHFGWTDPATRQARFDRYMSLDAGRFHARSHLLSIMYPEERIGLEQHPWPQTLWAAKAKTKLGIG